jgi:hypothetical protein
MDIALMLKDIEGMPWAIDFLNYISAREKGIKMQAKLHLNSFLGKLAAQPKQEQRIFIDKIFSLGFYTNDYSLYLPMNLYVDFVLPIIQQWKQDEPFNPTPFHWSNKFDDNKAGIELDPNNQIALEKFSTQLINKISLNQHEISAGYGYHGNPENDLALIDFFLPYTKNIVNSERRLAVIAQLSGLRKSAIGFIGSK